MKRKEGKIDFSQALSEMRLTGAFVRQLFDLFESDSKQIRECDDN